MKIISSGIIPLNSEHPEENNTEGNNQKEKPQSPMQTAPKNNILESPGNSLEKIKKKVNEEKKSLNVIQEKKDTQKEKLMNIYSERKTLQKLLFVIKDRLKELDNEEKVIKENMEAKKKKEKK